MSFPAVMPLYAPFGISFSYGSGVYLYDQSGHKYIDFYAGIAVMSMGHANPKIISAFHEQGEKVWHLSNLFPNEKMTLLAKLLTANSFADTVFFCNSGAESVECAFKVAKSYQCGNGNPQKYKFISFSGAFHGRTITAASASDPLKYAKVLGCSVDWFKSVPIAEQSVLNAIDGSIAGIIIEPIQGEGGIKIIPDNFLAFLRRVCDEHDLMLIYDCIQCGMGRTGKLFDHQNCGVIPDICTSAKGIASGFPVGACLATEKAARFMGIGTHGSTYGGNPLAMAVSYAVVTEILSDGFLSHVQRVGAYLRKKLEELAEKFPDHISEIRGRGLMLGIQFKGIDDITCLAKKISHSGVIVVSAAESVIRILPPLVIKESEIDEAIFILDSMLSLTLV